MRRDFADIIQVLSWLILRQRACPGGPDPLGEPLKAESFLQLTELPGMKGIHFIIAGLKKEGVMYQGCEQP